MGDTTNGADVNVEVAGQKVNLRNVKSLNTLATVATLALTVGLAVLLWSHAEAENKTNSAILQEIKEQNRRALDAQKNSAYYSCIQACLLEQPTDKRNSAICERQCAPVRQ